MGIEGDQADRLSMSGTKLEAPSKRLNGILEAADSKEELGNSQLIAQGGDFLSFANICYSQADDTAATLAKVLQGLREAPGKQENSLSAAMALLTPAKTVATEIIAEALTKAFHIPCSSTVRGDALAAMAIAGRRQKGGIDQSSPLSIVEVANAASGSSDGNDDMVKSVAGLLARARNGMEPFYLVRALQGKLAPGKEVVQSAVVKA